MVAMIALSNLVMALAEVLHLALTAYLWIIIARALLSWVNPDPYNPIVRFIYNITEPVLGYIRRRVPLVFSGIDLSPLLVLAALYFLDSFLVITLRQWALTLK